MTTARFSCLFCFFESVASGSELSTINLTCFDYFPLSASTRVESIRVENTVLSPAIHSRHVVTSHLIWAIVVLVNLIYTGMGKRKIPLLLLLFSAVAWGEMIPVRQKSDDRIKNDQIDERPIPIFRFSDPCEKVRCKSGKECALDGDDVPKCVCIQECPDMLIVDDAVCGTDNITYESECALRRLKCIGSSTKVERRKLRRLKVNYLGPCKVLSSCKKSELAEYPTRMRSWLKNVFLQMYDTAVEEGGLKEKQRYHGRKLYTEREKLQFFEESGPHELMEREFQKFYPLYKYPIHWKFAKLDRSKDKKLSKRELEPLRAPLIPMEHCTKAFFKKADKNRDRKISLNEWGIALGLKLGDIDPALVF